MLEARRSSTRRMSVSWPWFESAERPKIGGVRMRGILADINGLAMNKSDLGAVMSLVVLLTLSANARAQRVPPGVVVSNPQVYEVTITTTFVVPKNSKTLDVLRVWHACRPRGRGTASTGLWAHRRSATVRRTAR